MNAEEPLLAPAANQTLGTTGKDLPEQTRVASRVVPRPMTILSLIHQWQPMGIRIVVDLPYIGNDQNFLFLLRNGPFIPRWDYIYDDSKPDEGKPKLDVNKQMKQYAWNNMRNVWFGSPLDKYTWGKSGVKITQYDYPPSLATLAACFRRWRGDMQYRFRVVAGFATQGYTIIAPVKNVFSPILIYDEYYTFPAITRQDCSYREAMINAYVMADTSMFRHAEVTVPYEYPAPWYDQYNWMMHRVSPKSYATNVNSGSVDRNKPTNIITTEPHGDNWIGFGLRGKIETTQTGGQIVIELEYRAQEGFQFADPGLPMKDFVTPYQTTINDTAHKYDAIKTVPDPELTSDGLFVITSREGVSAKVARHVLGVQSEQQRAHSAHQHHRAHSDRHIQPHKREVDDSVLSVKSLSLDDDRDTRSRNRRDEEFSY